MAPCAIASRLEMQMLQERCSAAENGLSSAGHDVNALRTDRDDLQQQVCKKTVFIPHELGLHMNRHKTFWSGHGLMPNTATELHV